MAHALPLYTSSYLLGLACLLVFCCFETGFYVALDQTCYVTKDGLEPLIPLSPPGVVSAYHAQLSLCWGFMSKEEFHAS